jgi:hypothetical protein
MKITLQNQSLNDIRALYPDCFYNHPWYNNESFANKKLTGTWDVSLEPVQDSFNKTWKEQKNLLKAQNIAKKENLIIPPAAVVVYAMCKHFKETGKRAFENMYVRTSSVDSDGHLVFVGHFDAKGLIVEGLWGYRRNDDLGLAAARKLETGSLESLDELSLDRALDIVRAEGYEVTAPTLAKKFQSFREKHGRGSGKEYWEGLEKIAEEHYSKK